MRRDLVVLRARSQAGDDPVPPGWSEVVDPGASTGVLDVAHGSPAARERFGRRPHLLTFDALLWAHPGSALPSEVNRLYQEDFRLTVVPHVGWRPADPGLAVPGDAVKQVSLLAAAPGYGPERFTEHYRHHVGLARLHMPSLWQYVQNDVTGSTARPGQAPAIVAVSELWFATTDDFVNHYFPSDEDRIAFSAEEGFLDLTQAVSFVCTSLARVPES